GLSFILEKRQFPSEKSSTPFPFLPYGMPQKQLSNLSFGFISLRDRRAFRETQVSNRVKAPLFSKDLSQPPPTLRCLRTALEQALESPLVLRRLEKRGKDRSSLRRTHRGHRALSD